MIWKLKTKNSNLITDNCSLKRLIRAGWLNLKDFTQKIFGLYKSEKNATFLVEVTKKLGFWTDKSRKITLIIFPTNSCKFFLNSDSWLLTLDSYPNKKTFHIARGHNLCENSGQGFSRPHNSAMSLQAQPRQYVNLRDNQYFVS